MARTLAELPAGSRITDHISLGVIARFFPVEKIREVLEQTNRVVQRRMVRYGSIPPSAEKNLPPSDPRRDP